MTAPSADTPVVVCEATELARGVVRTVRLVPDAHGLPRQAIVLRDREGRLRAYVNLCRHLPIPLDAGSGDFLAPDDVHIVCGTHGALYRPEDGLCIEGPCEGMFLYPLDVRDNDGRIELYDRRPTGG